MKSDTPRTDSMMTIASYMPINRVCVPVEFCRQLERELNEAKALIQVYRNEIQTGKLERTSQQQILDALNNE